MLPSTFDEHDSKYPLTQNDKPLDMTSPNNQLCHMTLSLFNNIGSCNVEFSSRPLIFKGNTQFVFLCNPQKSGTSRVHIIFLQITLKILTKGIFHWLELITEILNFLQIFSVRKTTTPLFQYFRNSPRMSTKN